MYAPSPEHLITVPNTNKISPGISVFNKIKRCPSLGKHTHDSLIPYFGAEPNSVAKLVKAPDHGFKSWLNLSYGGGEGLGQVHFHCIFIPKK